jgi:hypothetical protein
LGDLGNGEGFFSGDPAEFAGHGAASGVFGYPRQLNDSAPLRLFGRVESTTSWPPPPEA